MHLLKSPLEQGTHSLIATSRDFYSWIEISCNQIIYKQCIFTHCIPFHFNVGVALQCLCYTDLENLTAEQMEFSTHVVLYHRHLKIWPQHKALTEN